MKKDKKILILGSSGLIGISLTKILKKKFDIVTTYHKKKRYEGDIKLNLLSKESVQRAFQISKPDVVINLCAIYNNINFCEKNQKLVMAINGTSLKTISKLSNKYDSHLVYLSSDYVFDGELGNYKEQDPLNPKNFYGFSKSKGEEYVQEIAKNYSIIRTSMVYGKNDVKKTLPDWILESIENNNSVDLIDDQYMSPTYLENFCNMLSEVIEKNYNGILHLAGQDRLSRYEFGIKLVKVYQKNPDVLIPVKSKKFNLDSKIPNDSSLNVNKAMSILKMKPEKVEKSLEKYISQI